MLFLRTFGGLSLENGGRPLSGAAAQRRPLAVLAVIAASGEHGIPREKVQSLFWPDSDAERARGSLKQVLYSFRRDLNEPEITIGTADLRLNPAVIASDVAVFRSAIADKRREAAANTYSGRFLEGLYWKDLDELNRWIEKERDLLAREYRSTLEMLARSAADSREYAASAGWWAKLATDDPCASRIALAYMRALDAAGEREAAIRYAETHARIVRSELDAEPDPSIAALVGELRSTSSVSKQSMPAPQLSHIVAGKKSEADKAVEARRARRRWRAPLAVASIAIIAIALGSFVRGTKTLPPIAQADRLVVVPFENRTGDPSLDALGSMGADWISDGLSRTNLLSVADPATAAAAVRDVEARKLAKRGWLVEIANATGATKVVSGSFYRRGDSLEFHARVSDAATGKVLGAIEPVTVASWSAAEGVESLRQNTLSLLARLIDQRLSQVVFPDTKPPKFAAYKEFVTGVDLLARRTLGEADSADEDWDGEARRHFVTAYSLDTSFVTALVWTLFTADPADSLDAGKHVVERIARNRDHLTPLERQEVDYFRAASEEESLRAAKAASDIAPRSEWSWMAGRALFPQNRPLETLKYFDRLDPDHGWMRQGWEYYWYVSSQARHMTGDLPATAQWLRRARARFPDNVPIASAYARSLALSGKSGSVGTLVHQILMSDVEWKVFYVYGIIEDLHRHGRTDEATAVYNLVLPWYQSKGKAVTEADRRFLAQIFYSMKMTGAAERQFSEVLRDFPASTWKTFYTGHLATLAAAKGDTAGVRRLMHSVPKEIQQWPGENSYWRARVAAELGKKGEATRLLQSAFDEGYSQVSLSHSMWYDFPNLQGYPPFEALVASDR